MTPNVVNISWSDVRDYCQIISDKAPRNIDVIVPIVRGGMIPAAVISNILKISNVVPIVWQTRDGATKDFNRWRDLVDSGKNILIVDDLVDSGKTLYEMGSVALDLKNVHVATMIKNITHTVTHPLIDKVIFAKEIDKKTDPRWIVFPWESI